MKKFLLFLAGALCCIGIGFTQGPDDPTIQALIEKLEKFRYNYPQEKVHLHMDKPYYTIGDSIWFKAYVINAQDRTPGKISKILNVELITDRDSVARSIKVPLLSGLGWAQIALTDELTEGNYRIRAYTDWMRNFDESYFFDRTLRIGNTVSNPVQAQVNYIFSKVGNDQKVNAEIRYTDIDGRSVSGKTVDYTVLLNNRSIIKAKATTDAQGKINVSFINPMPDLLRSGRISTRITLDNQRRFMKNIPIKSTSDSVDVQFFPEGGNLVAGLLSKVGFKAVQSDGWGAGISGYITGSNGAKLVDIRSEHAGMGSFNLIPAANEQYKAHVTFKDGSTRIIALPAIQASGYTVNVISSMGENILVRISASEQLAAAGDALLIAQSHSYAHYVSKIAFSKNVITASIPKKRFPTGILQLTLFNPAMQPVSERLVFVDNHDPLKISVSTNKTEYTKREQVKLQLSALSADTAALANFSVSVIDESKVPASEDDEVTIQSNLLLSSDLRGFIEKPNYYFASDETARKRQLDNLMLTQGWRRFSWKSIAAEDFPKVSFQPAQYLSISGMVNWRGEPASSGKVTLFSNSGGVLFTDTLTDAAGRFRFDNLSYSDTSTFIVQARNEKNRKNVAIEVDKEPVQPMSTNVNAALVDPNLDISIYDYLKNSYSQYESIRAERSILLDPVEINRKRLENVKGSGNFNGAGNADKVFTIEDFDKVPAIPIFQYLTGRVAGVTVKNDEVWLNTGMGRAPMTVYLDGMMVSQSFLSMMNVSQLQSIEVLKSSNYLAVYGINGGNGVILLTSKRGGVTYDAYYEYAPGIITFKPKGYSIAREFYSPNYHDPKVDTQKPDLRSTIYWNPFVNTLKGTSNIEYFNSDGTGTYKIVVEGISPEGAIGRAVYRYNVK